MAARRQGKMARRRNPSRPPNRVQVLAAAERDFARPQRGRRLSLCLSDQGPGQLRPVRHSPRDPQPGGGERRRGWGCD
eukprot:724936-Hanusia_phi.AAC.1